MDTTTKGLRERMARLEGMEICGSASTIEAFREMTEALREALRQIDDAEDAVTRFQTATGVLDGADVKEEIRRRVLDEREACAKMAETLRAHVDAHPLEHATHIAAAIRARK